LWFSSERSRRELEAVWLYGPRARRERPQTQSELRLLVLLRHSSRSDRVMALELLWQAALAEQATGSYFSIRVADQASAERRRAIDKFLAPDVEPEGGSFYLPARPPPPTGRGPLV
jgi:hypothetical protein